MKSFQFFALNILNVVLIACGVLVLFHSAYFRMEHSFVLYAISLWSIAGSMFFIRWTRKYLD